MSNDTNALVSDDILWRRYCYWAVLSLNLTLYQNQILF